MRITKRQLRRIVNETIRSRTLAESSDLFSSDDPSMEIVVPDTPDGQYRVLKTSPNGNFVTGYDIEPAYFDSVPNKAFLMRTVEDSEDPDMWNIQVFSTLEKAITWAKESLRDL